MDPVRPFRLCTHEENYRALTRGDRCCVRWDENGVKQWYCCAFLAVLPFGCLVDYGDERYELSWLRDELITNPTERTYEFLTMHPKSTVIEVGKVKYVVPTAEGAFTEAISSINTLRKLRNQREVDPSSAWTSFTIDQVANFAQFKKIVFLEV